ncbi:MAG: D-alanyl-D-alanine carboxypeptidase/D-alanyl-D-alanine-endopeptidase [Proteobacteria bacterium]|nr:D-alanyl-D-alanine carboxypeptidase/D-alanyl-D-alanine-endopeptidase [Pseudomonadota bacterium]
MRRAWIALPALLGFGLSVALPLGAQADDSLETRLEAPLEARLDAVLKSKALRGARVSALVERQRTGEILYQVAPDRPLTPASNVKILTAMASLSVFGPTYRFETLIHSDRWPDSEGAVGQLVVRGSGDPAMNSEDWWRVANALRHAGLRRVRGDLVLDDAAFDRERWHASWGKTSSRAYHAPVGALTANYGSFAVRVAPGVAPGDPVAVAVDPPVPYLRVVNRARTASPGARSTLVVDRAESELDRSQGHGDWEIVTIHGAVPAGREPDTYYRSVLDPARYAGAVLRMQLEANGIQVDGATRVRGPVPVGTELYLHEGRQLAEIVRLFVKYSNNAVAESLVKAMAVHENGGAGPGSWDAGAPILARRLEELGLDPAGFSLIDGSGLSYGNKVTVRTMVRALQISGRSFRFGPELLAALPIAARDGTLERRAQGAAGEVRAKTGLLNGVTALSGLAHLGDGDTAVFSIIVNGYRGTDEVAMDALDAFAAELTRASLATPAKPASDVQPSAEPGSSSL